MEMRLININGKNKKSQYKVDITIKRNKNIDNYYAAKQ